MTYTCLGTPPQAAHCDQCGQPATIVYEADYAEPDSGHRDVLTLCDPCEKQTGVRRWKGWPDVV